MYFTEGYLNLSASLIQPKGDLLTLQTTLGDITIKLYRKKTPKTTENFYQLAKVGKYDETIFHRVIENFMIQGGDFENFNGTGGESFEGEYFEDEFAEGVSHVRGAISMANRGPNTNGSQFFIVHKDAPFLDGRHTVFGHIIKGMDTVDKIATQKTNMLDAPLETVKILKVILNN
ncbi:peptidylprolyl isomerase [Candidatus Gracilibacteria bacterium]|nr:peptidylprolyl isomerase [Candidatus Gracilibacteria bacterium]